MNTAEGALRERLAADGWLAGHRRRMNLVVSLGPFGQWSQRDRFVVAPLQG